MVKVGTGSGKSTVIPPYLIGLGYKKVVVTQPRRLPCREIYKRICQVFGEGVAGYHVGDGSLDEKNSLVYMTDGLIKMKAIYDDSVFDDIDVMVIDEIHERSANIDVLLLLLYSYFLAKKRKLKLILCSATIDTQIG
jgi:HrpA-like RNA helicase